MSCLSERHIGIEIEAETEEYDITYVRRQLEGPLASQRWEVELDHSLRGGSYGWEIKTAGEEGLPYETVRTSMLELLPMLTHSTGTWRAAVHCHVDVRDLMPRKQGLLLGLLYVLDDSIFERFSPARRESNFCVPLGNEVMRTLDTIHMLDNNTLAGMGEDCGLCKYTSINVKPVATEMGTFEFRHMGTPAGSRNVNDVCRSLVDIWMYASTCAEIVNFVGQLRLYKSIRDIAELLANEDVKRVILSWGLSINQGALLTVLDRFCATAPKIPMNVDTLTLYKASGFKRPRPWNSARDLPPPRFETRDGIPVDIADILGGD
jgi:hypothetical protein